MADYRWVDLLGEFESIDGGRVYKGREYDDPTIKPAAPNEPGESQDQPTQLPSHQAAKRVWVGQSICDQRFKDGTIKVEIEFEEFDLRCIADIVLQYDPNTQDMLTFSLGGDVPEEPGGNFYALRQYATQQFATEPNIGTTGGATTKKWHTIRYGGERQNLKAGRRYQIEVSIKGLAIRVLLDGVEIVRHTLPFALPGLQVGILCGGPKNIYFRDFQVNAEKPQAFIVMQFNTPEYEALFNEVIKPICAEEGFQVYRADFAKRPGLIISDITKQITESQVIIAEITPINGNVYYEVGYADALRKPVVLIANRTVGQIPFDVRPYRTIFYENSIGGKRMVEETLREYLKNILTPQSLLSDFPSVWTVTLPARKSSAHRHVVTFRQFFEWRALGPSPCLFLLLRREFPHDSQQGAKPKVSRRLTWLEPYSACIGRTLIGLDLTVTFVLIYSCKICWRSLSTASHTTLRLFV